MAIMQLTVNELGNSRKLPFVTEENPKSDKWAIVDEAYSGEFLVELGANFNFDALTPKMAQEIRVAGWRYLADTAIDNDDGSMLANSRKEYRALKKQIANFAELLARPEYGDISSDIYFAALRAGAEPPKTDFPHLSEFEMTRGAPYLAELTRLLNLLETAANEGIKNSSPARGRKKNYAVENFVRRAAPIWIEYSGKPFTVDYHKGSGVTQAFDYVKTLIHRLDPDIPEKSIVTAMRAIIAENNKLAER